MSIRSFFCGVWNKYRTILAVVWFLLVLCVLWYVCPTVHVEEHRTARRSKKPGPKSTLAASVRIAFVVVAGQGAHRTYLGFDQRLSRRTNRVLTQATSSPCER